MPRRSRPAVDFHHQRFMQISESHCGPAAIQMMLSNLGIEVTQEQVAEAGGATSLIAMHGMRVDQLALAVYRLAPEVVFYCKDHATLDELVRIVVDYRHPVGVEWQGVFEDEDAARLDRANIGWNPATGAEYEIPAAQENADQQGFAKNSETQDNTDYGHYSLVIHANRRRKELIVADPYKDFYAQARIFGFKEFEARWYDFNEILDPLTGRPELVEDFHLLFVITRRNVLFPLRLGLNNFEFTR
jgi:hypothetical protein